MSQSLLSIVNTALRLIGAEPVISLDQPGKVAKTATQLWPGTLEEVLELYEWASALHRQTLAPVEMLEALDGYRFCYQLPVDPKYIRMGSIVNHSMAAWMIEGPYFYTNVESAVLRYVAVPEDPGRLNPTLRQTLTYRLAAALSPALKTTRDLVVEQLYEMSLARAKGVDTRTTRSAQRPEVRWDQARHLRSGS